MLEAYDIAAKKEYGTRIQVLIEASMTHESALSGPYL